MNGNLASFKPLFLPSMSLYGRTAFTKDVQDIEFRDNKNSLDWTQCFYTYLIGSGSIVRSCGTSRFIYLTGAGAHSVRLME
jgi:hypothetical protein